MSINFSRASSINDNEVIQFINQIDYTNSLWNKNVTRNFCSFYRNWIESTQLNSIKGLDTFNYSVYSNGTSQAFDLFYIKNKERRFRCFKGEYVYHQIAWRNNWKDWIYIEDDELQKNDALIVSLPFSDTGNKHTDLDYVLKKCEALHIPVLVDCAYFGICNNIEIDLNYSCITDVAFSLSKVFPVANARIGIRFSKVDDDDLMFVYDKFDYNNKLGSHLGLELIKNFSPDFMYNKYKLTQRYCCKMFNVEQSNTVIFGIDKSNQYPQYNRGSTTNRLGIQELYQYNENQIKEIINGSSV